MRDVVTGASGFIGHRLCEVLRDRGRRIVAVTRTPDRLPAGVDAFPITRIESEGEWLNAVRGAEVIYHLLGRAHTGDPSIQSYRSVNVASTEALLRAAIRNGARKVVFLSSAKVNGDSSGLTAFLEDDPRLPQDAYGITKREAEQRVRQLTTGTSTMFTIVRSPLVYGPGVKANFLALMRAVRSGIPLPLKNISNLRSLIFLDNLVDALARCASPDADGEAFYVSDQRDVSTAELVRMLAVALGRRPRLFSFPKPLLRALLTAIGGNSVADRLYGSLVVDSSKISRKLGWRAPFTIEEGLCATAQWFSRTQT